MADCFYPIPALHFAEKLRRHDVLVAPPREDVLVVAVVALAVVRLYVPVRTHYLREPLRALRVGVKRRDVVGNLFRRLAERLADVPPALVLLSGLPRLPDLPIGADYRPRSGEAGIHRVDDAVHLRLAESPSVPGSVL